jgi:hypothetical protein
MPADPKAQRAFHEIAEELAGMGAAESQMFGMPTMKVGGKAFVGVPGSGGMVFKLPPDEVRATLELKGTELFDPGMGRPMREWVVVPAAQSRRWRPLAEVSLAYVAAAAAKKPSGTRSSTKKPPAKKSDKKR